MARVGRGKAKGKRKEQKEKEKKRTHFKHKNVARPDIWHLPAKNDKKRPKGGICRQKESTTLPSFQLHKSDVDKQTSTWPRRTRFGKKRNGEHDPEKNNNVGPVIKALKAGLLLITVTEPKETNGRLKGNANHFWVRC